MIREAAAIGAIFACGIVWSDDAYRFTAEMENGQWHEVAPVPLDVCKRAEIELTMIASVPVASTACEPYEAQRFIVDVRRGEAPPVCF